jgi:hypothetical protein
MKNAQCTIFIPDAICGLARWIRIMHCVFTPTTVGTSRVHEVAIVAMMDLFACPSSAVWTRAVTATSRKRLMPKESRGAGLSMLHVEYALVSVVVLCLAEDKPSTLCGQ